MLKKIKFLGISFLILACLAFKVADDRLFEITRNLDVFSTMYKELNAYYVDEINPTKAIQTGIAAMLKELDPYTVFYPEDMIEDYMTQNAGSYNGIGATIEYHEGKHVVSMLFEEAPADKSGVKVGDEILKINGIDVTNKNEAEFGRLLKGQKGTAVKLHLNRFGQSKPIVLSVDRDVVKTPSVPHSGMITKEVGYVQLTEFSNTAAKDVKKAVQDLKEKGMTKLVIDLRNNGGGLLNMAIEICNFFLPKGLLIVETKGKVKEWNQKYLGSEAPIDAEMPIVILINGSSASASEIVSGTMQDYDRGVLIGQKSFGKGLVQVTRKLSFNTQMKVTTSKYYIPSGRCIQAIDYGHRSEDGLVSKLPDSLRTAFKTKNNRTVYDGGGVEPDIKTKSNALSDFSKALVKEKLVFDYATKYYFENQSNKPSENFDVTDEAYEKFSSWFQTQKFKYTSKEQKAINELLNITKNAGQYDKLKSQFSDIQKLAGQNNAEQLKQNREQIKELLELEILSRFYYQKAMKFVSFEKDEDVQAALNLFDNIPKYHAILKGK